MGAAYLNILETGPLAGIEDPKVLQYALVVSYANGAGALLRTFFVRTEKGDQQKQRFGC